MLDRPVSRVGDDGPLSNVPPRLLCLREAGRDLAGPATLGNALAAMTDGKDLDRVGGIAK